MTSNPLPVRIATALALLALLPGCERTPPPSPPATSAMPASDAAVNEQATDATATSATASNASASTPTQEHSISTDDVRIGTEVGERVLGRGLSSTGRAGWLMFGPYVALPAGNYQVALQGAVHEGHAGVVYLDVARGKGTEVLAAVNLEEAVLRTPPSPDGIAVLGFTLEQPATDLEVRIRVVEASKLSVSRIVIRAVP